METIYNPSESFGKYKEDLAKNAEKIFDELAQRSCVDKAANKAVCKELYTLTTKRGVQSDRQDRLTATRVILFVLMVVCVGGGIFLALNPRAALNLEQAELFALGDAVFNIINLGLIGLGLLFLIVAVGPLSKKIRMSEQIIAELDGKIAERKALAYQQMAKLNESFGDDIPLKLIQMTVPKLEFDPFFTRDRMTELKDDFGFEDKTDSYSSALDAHSGQINGNPFVFVRKKLFKWGKKTYYGHKTIYWTEYVRDSKGNRVSVTRSQTLTASYTAPFPCFSKQTYVIYGNDAAPNLSFDRESSDLATSQGIFARMRFNSKLKELRKFSQDLTDDSDYTLLNNEKFEVYFETKNRDNEVEYRLLFTPLAQVQMLELLTDTVNGFGGNFAFHKRKKINLIEAKHLQDMTLSTSAENFSDFDFERCRRNFVQWNQAFFRAVYFALAPLLCIPLYQQYRTRKTIYGQSKSKSTHWEWEVLSNRLGQVFDHSNCVTDHILKTRLVRDLADGRAEVQVTSHGFSGTEHTYWENVWGGDGRMHSVPVQWVEYNEVQQNTNVVVSDTADEPAYTTESDRFMTSHRCQMKI